MMLDLREADDRLGAHGHDRSAGSRRPARRARPRSIWGKLTTGSARTATIDLRKADDRLGRTATIDLPQVDGRLCTYGHDRSAGS